MTLEILTSDSLSPIKHGFFTRKGGASSGVFEGLNCGLGSSDQREAVEVNRSRVAEAMGVAASHLAGVHQIHSAVVHEVTAASASDRPKGDGLVTAEPGVALSVLTADCAPVLFADAKNRVIGAAHSGWKGAVGGVLGETVAAMERLGAERDQICACVGPTISQRSYEVGPEFFEDFLAEDDGYARFFAGGNGDRMMFDLPGFCLETLRRVGVKQAEWTGHCTYLDESRFYSYRRTTHRGEPDYGRLIASIVL